MLSIFLFKIRFPLLGILSGIIYSTVLTFVDQFDIVDLLVGTISGLIFWDLIFYYTEYATQKQTPLLLNYDETEIISEKAVIVTDNTKVSGRLILTNKRVSFIANNRGRAQWDYLHSELKHIKIHFSIADGFFIKFGENEEKIKVNHPYFWRGRIGRVCDER